MSTSNLTLSNLQLLSEEEGAISPDSAVVAHRSALAPQQVNESNDDALSIDSLPDEMILKVFSYLTQNQLCQIARVCQKWKTLTKSPALWRNVSLKVFWSSYKENDAQSLKCLIDGLPSCVTFIRLDFVRRGYPDSSDHYSFLDFEQLFMKLRRNCPDMQVLIIKHCTTSTDLPKIINFCSQFLIGLKKLVFRDFWFQRDSGTEELKDNSNIEVLDFYHCGGASYTSREMQFSKLPSLTELRLAFTFADDAWFVDDASFLNQLRVLDLGSTCITDRTFLAIQRHGQNLKELYMCDIDEDLSVNNPAFPHIETICLCGTGVTCDGLASLIRCCPSLTNVYVREDVARTFAEHPFVVANKGKAGIVKSIDWEHDHIVDY